MRNIIWTISLVASAAVTPVAAAAESSKEEAIGVGSGAVVGAIAGGPIGLVIGSAIGARIGNNWHDKNSELNALSDSLNESDETIEELKLDVVRLASRADRATAELDRLDRNGQRDVVNLLQAGIESDWLFRTDEYVLAESTGERLDEFARKLARMDNIRIRLDGYADSRGAVEYNQSLSEKRIDTIRQQLLAAGVDDARISAIAHGEVESNDDDTDSFALERRVSLKVFITDDTAVASFNE